MRRFKISFALMTQQSVADTLRRADKKLAIEVEETVHPGRRRRSGENGLAREAFRTAVGVPRQTPAHRLYANIGGG